MTVMTKFKFAVVFIALKCKRLLISECVVGDYFYQYKYIIVPCTCISVFLSSSISLVWSGSISGFCRMIFDWPESDFRPTQEKGNVFFVKGSVLAVYW